MPASSEMGPLQIFLVLAFQEAASIAADTAQSTGYPIVQLFVLQRWRDLVLETDPDIIIGYNICNFDLPYLLRRAEALSIADFPFWGRLKKRQAPAYSFYFYISAIIQAIESNSAPISTLPTVYFWEASAQAHSESLPFP